MTSGRAIAKASDDPAGTVTALGLRSDLKAQAQHARNAEDGLAWLTAGEDALRSGTDLLRRARDLTLQGLSTGSASAESRQAIAVEIGRPARGPPRRGEHDATSVVPCSAGPPRARSRSRRTAPTSATAGR